MRNTLAPFQPVMEVERIEPPMLHDALQFEYLQNEALRHALLHGEPISVLRVLVLASVHSSVTLLRTRLRDTDIIAHMDDGTFAVLLPSTTFLEATVVAEKLRARRPMSIGVACSDGGLHDVLQRSQRAMRKAEMRGGDRVCF